LLLPHEEMMALLPKLKSRVLFIAELEQLRKSQQSTVTIQSSESDLDSTMSPHLIIDEFVDENGTIDMNESILNNNSEEKDVFEECSSNGMAEVDVDIHEADSHSRKKSSLSTDYEMPPLPPKLQSIVDDGRHSSFNGYTNYRKEVLSILFQDVSINHKLMYVYLVNVSFLLNVFLIVIPIEKITSS